MKGPGHRIWLVAIAIGIGGVVVASGQEEKTVVKETLAKLEALTTQLRAQKTQKGRQPEVLPPSSSTRDEEETLNRLTRESVSLRQALGGELAPKAIYGVDDRRNYDHPQVTNWQRRGADSTVVLVDMQNLIPSADGASFDLRGGNILGSDGSGLCTPAQAEGLGKPEEPFYDEPNPGFCSGFRVGSDRIATAGHCLKTEAQCTRTRFIANFYKTIGGSPEKHVPASDVYACKRLLDGKLTTDGPDWRLAQLDRPMKSGMNVRLRQLGQEPQLQSGDGVTVIGYPLGLPVKIAAGAVVRGFGKGFFIANLDTYEGNSGSAVFNTEQLTKGDMLVEGILVRGEKDFDVKTPCFVSKRCTVAGCRGEDVTLASEFAAAAGR